MNSNLQNSKSLLAKLLAAENITVSHQNTKTAYFDLKSRTLVCPVWKDMDGHLYDLLMGHEVGHALNTPEQGWHSAIHDDNGKSLGKFKGFLNVIEDARIEKQVKRKFPGLAKSFAQAYKGLYERDFFGVKNVDINKLNLIDRINIRCKLGAHIPVSFNDDERKFLVEIDNAETWDEVVDIARRVYSYCKEQKEQEQSQINNMDDLREEIQQERAEADSEFEDFNDEESDEESDDEQDGDGEDSDDSELSEESDDSDSEDSDEDGEESEDESDSDYGKEGAQDYGDTTDDEPESVTDKSFRAREQELINQTGEVFMVELPEANLSKIILQNKVVMDDLEGWVKQQIADPHRTYGRNGISYEAVAAKCVRKFNTNNKKFIMHILKEFEMRKKASDYARVQTAKTGELNLNVLHNYKFTNDLFKKIQVVPKGKNHGMIMYVDMSGSMTDILRNTIEQCLVLVSFCRLAKIPFDVYGFSNDAYKSSGPQVYGPEKFTMSDVNQGHIGSVDSCGFHLKHLIGSTLSPSEYRRSFSNLCIVWNEYMRGYYRENQNDTDHGAFYYNWEEAGFGLNGTPFQQTLLASREMIKKFQAKHKLDVVNVIYLTDGEGQEGIQMPYTRGVVYLVDKKTKKKVRVNNCNPQAALTELVRDVTGCKHIGFFLASKNDVARILKGLEWEKKIDYDQSRELKKQFREEKFFSVSNLGYDKYFYIQSANGTIEEDKMQIVAGMTKHKMANEFSKSVNSKKSSRALVTQFAEEISASLKWVA